MTAPDRGRRVLGFVGGTALRAYGVAGAMSVALSDAETWGGKAGDAIKAVPTLQDRFRDVKYVADHREEIQASLDYVHDNAPGAEELERQAERSMETLEAIRTTWDHVATIDDALQNWRPWRALPDAWDQASAAWDARPDLGSLRDLSEVADDVAPFVEHGEVLVPRLYDLLLVVMDNFASDELLATLAVMVVAVLVGHVGGAAVGFWGRRGRPPFVTRTLQRLGARRHAEWYADNLHDAIGEPLVDVARQRFRTELREDPENALDPHTFDELERYFAARRGAG